MFTDYNVNLILIYNIFEGFYLYGLLKYIINLYANSQTINKAVVKIIYTMQAYIFSIYLFYDIVNFIFCTIVSLSFDFS